MPYKVDYNKIYEYLNTMKDKVVTPSGIAYAVGVERIYPGTMTKLVNDKAIEHCAEKGFYRVIL